MLVSAHVVVMYVTTSVGSHGGINVGTVLQETLNYVRHSSLTGKMKRRVKSPSSRPWPRGAVDIGSVLHQEAGRGRVVEENGSVEERQLDSVAATVPGVGVTSMDHL